MKIYRAQNFAGKTSRVVMPLFLLALAFVFFSPFFLKGEIFLGGDILYRFYPWKYYAPADFRPHNTLISDPVNNYYAENYGKQLKAGRMELWTPYIFGGMPAAAGFTMGIPGRYYPVKMLLYYLFETPVALTLLLYIHVFLMGYFMFLYLSEIGAGWQGALFGGTAYMFNGCAMVWLEYEMWVTVSAFLPLLLLFLEKFVRTGRWKFVFSSGLVFGLIILMGNHQLNIYICLLLAFYLMFGIFRHYRESGSLRGAADIFSGFAVAGALGLLIGAVELFPFAELVSQSSRAVRDMGFRQLFEETARMPFRYFITLLFPDFFGSPLLPGNCIPHADTQRYMNYNELSLYMGIPVIFAVALCLAGRKNSFQRFYIFLSVLAVAIICGTFVYYPFYKLVPGMGKMNPTRIIFLLVFSGSVLSAYGIRAVEDLSGRRKHMVAAVFFMLFIFMIFIGITGGKSGVTAWFNQEQFKPLKLEWLGDYYAMMRLRAPASPVIYRPLVFGALSLGLFLILVYSGNKKSSRAAFGLILLLLSYELISFGRGYNTLVNPDRIYPKTPSIEFLLKQPGLFRVAQDSQKGLSPDTLAPFEIEEAGGYGSIYPKRVNLLMSYIGAGEEVFGGKALDRWVTISNFSSPLLDLLNVGYVLTSPYYNMNDPRYKLVFREDLSVYENTTVMPRTFAVGRYVVRNSAEEVLRYMGSPAFDMRGEVVLEETPKEELAGSVNRTLPQKPARQSVTVERYSPDEMQIRAFMPESGWLVLTDTYYPGWEARVNGRESRIYRADCNFRAVELPPGNNSVVFMYRPFSIRIGLALTVTAALLAAFGLLISLLRERTAARGRQT